MRLMPVLLLLLLSTWLHAAPQDFARGITIAVQDGEPGQRVALPADVYRWVTRDDLGDLRVYDGKGDPLPYALQRPEPAASQTPWIALPVFPLPAQRKSDGATGVDIELGENGAVVAVHGPAATMPGETGFLVDASDFRRQLSELRLIWPETGNDFVSRVRIESSDDLNAWRTLVNAATVAALQTEGERVRLDQIELPAVDARYLRLRQLDSGQPLALEGIQARSRVALEPQREWLTLQGTPDRNGYRFDTGGRFPVDRVTAQPDRETFLLEVRLSAREEPDAAWQDLGSHRFYRARVDGQIASSEPAVSGNPRYRYWRVEAVDDNSPPLKLRVGWQPDELIFLRQGSPPYLLAYGQADLSAAQWPMAELLEQLEVAKEASGSKSIEDASAADRLAALPLAVLGEPHMLGGKARLQPKPKPVDWPTLALWGALLIGVGLVAALAYRLLRAGAGH